MYRYKAEIVIEEENLTKIIKMFKETEIPRFKRLENYYRVENEILKRTAKDGKPNNKLAHGYAKYITKMATGYFMGKGVRYIVEDEELEEYDELLAGILDNNYTDDSNFEVAKEASKKGISYEILFIDENGALRTKKLNAEDVIPIYSQKLGEFLEAAIRIWSEKDIEQKDITELAELYTKTEIYTYEKKPKDKNYKLIDIKKHMLDDIPVIIYWNNEELKGDYEDILTLIDAYDKGQSDTANDSEYFADAYLYITGASGGITTGDGYDDENSGEAYKTMRRERVLELDEKGQAGWLVKDVNDTAQENYKSRLYKDIFLISQVPPLSDESFAGNLTGVAIRYKFSGLEELTTEKERKFLAAQKKKIRMITDYINTRYNKSFNADDVLIKTERNFIDNLTEIIEQVNKLEGVVSKKTQLGLLPIIKNVSDEIENIKQENSKEIENNDIYNSFSKNYDLRKESE